MQTERIISGRAGCFLDPPNFPNYLYKVETDLNLRKENRGSLSITYAANCGWVDPDVRARCGKLIADWYLNKPELTSPEVTEWISSVLGYFRNCYVRSKDGSRNVSNLLIDAGRDPMKFWYLHAGVLKIQDFYPEFLPTEQHFISAKWRG